MPSGLDFQVGVFHGQLLTKSLQVCHRVVAGSERSPGGAGCTVKQTPSHEEGEASTPAQEQGLPKLPPGHNLRKGLVPELLDRHVGHPRDRHQGCDA